MRPRAQRSRRALAGLGWPALALGGLLVGVVALASDPGRPGLDGAAGRFLLDLPEPLVTVAAGAGALAVLLLFAFLLALARRQAKDKQAARVRWGALLFPLLIAVAVLWRHGPLDGLLFSPIGQHSRIGGATGPPDAGAAPVSVPLVTIAVSALLVAAALASLGLACLLLFGDRVAAWWARASARRDPFATAVEESLDDLRAESDARVAIIRCYRRFERVLARSSVPRAPWQTPIEFMRAALERLPLPAEAVSRLTRLFELARFSNQPLTPADRDAAWASLLEIRDSLDADAHLAADPS